MASWLCSRCMHVHEALPESRHCDRNVAKPEEESQPCGGTLVALGVAAVGIEKAPPLTGEEVARNDEVAAIMRDYFEPAVSRAALPLDTATAEEQAEALANEEPPTQAQLREAFDRPLLTGPGDACAVWDCLLATGHEGDCYQIGNLHDEGLRAEMRALRNG